MIGGVRQNKNLHECVPGNSVQTVIFLQYTHNYHFFVLMFTTFMSFIFTVLTKKHFSLFAREPVCI